MYDNRTAPEPSETRIAEQCSYRNRETNISWLICPMDPQQVAEGFDVQNRQCVVPVECAHHYSRDATAADQSTPEKHA